MRALVAVIGYAAGGAACGDNVTATGTFAVVGHSDLQARGMNAALTIADDTAYVGSRIDGKGILIVDIADPSAPAVVGEVAAPTQAVSGMSSRELRAVPELNLLVVLDLDCSPSLHGCSGATPVENLQLYDITARRAPHLAGTYYIPSSQFQPRSPHEFFLWRDPVDPTRVLAFLTTPGAAPQLDIVDLTVPAAPISIIKWDAVVDGGLPIGGANNILHSVSASDDGRTLYLSHQTDGLVVVDQTNVIDKIDPPILHLVTPRANALIWPGAAMGPHSAVVVPERPLLVVSEEVYAPPYGMGCPWGHVHLADITDPAKPVQVGEYALPDPPSCDGIAPNTVFSSHNATALHDLALVTWYAGGIQAIDISDPTLPVQLAEFRPEPLPQVAVEDPGLGGSHVEMWSYPIIKDGLIYVVDVRNGLYVLSYHGRWGEQVGERRFLEGNSNLGAFMPRHL